jgi:hypothetical protein
MNRLLFLASVSSLALLAQQVAAAERPPANFFAHAKPAELPKGVTVLYNQNSNVNWNDGGINSQNYTSGILTSLDCAAADDFVVPKNKKWTVTEVDITGIFYNGSGPATSENVVFYKDDHGKPGKAVRQGTFQLDGADSDGSFVIGLPGRGLSLGPGRYWLSVVINCSFYGGCSEWDWATTYDIHGDQGMWERPKAGDICSTWQPIPTCLGGSPQDFMFELRGKAKGK